MIRIYHDREEVGIHKKLLIAAQKHTKRNKTTTTAQ
jgi:hypothetical protein